MALALAGIALAWVIVVELLSLAGWRTLAAQYKSGSGSGATGASTPSVGQRFRFQSVQLRGWVGYNQCANVGVDPLGLHLSLWPIFRPGHPPLQIPWSDIDATAERKWFVDVATLHLLRCPRVTVRITRRLAERLAAHSHGGFALPERTIR